MTDHNGKNGVLYEKNPTNPWFFGGKNDLIFQVFQARNNRGMGKPGGRRIPLSFHYIYTLLNSHIKLRRSPRASLNTAFDKFIVKTAERDIPILSS